MRELLSFTCARIGRSFLAISSYLSRPAVVPPLQKPPLSSSASVDKPSAASPVQTAQRTASRGTHRYEVEVLGQRVSGKFKKDATLAALRLFASLDPGCLPRVRELTRKRVRVYVTDNLGEMYPPCSAQSGGDHVEIVAGWFMATNIGEKEMVPILKAACKATGLEYGKDVCLSF